MNFSFSATLFSVVLLVLPALAQESVPLWPNRNVPHEKSGDADSVPPILHLYPTRGQQEHNGAGVVICPGGGYGGLAVDHEGHQIAQWFNARGVSAFVLHYRLGSKGYHYPAQLADVQRALRWVRAHSEAYEIDPDRTAIMGFSAGGHLASMGATLFDREAYELSDEIDKESARPDFAILCYPVISMDREVTHQGSRRNLLGPEQADSDDFADSVSTEKNIPDRAPPTFIFQTDADAAVPAENAVRFYLGLREKGIPAEMHIYQRGPHGVGLYLGDPVLGTWSDLLDRWLRSNSFYAPPSKRAAVQGTVMLDGQPVSWGVLSFHPENRNQPVVSVRVRRGKFSVPEEDGPVLGKAKVSFSGSIWEATKDQEDGAVTLESLEPGGGEVLLSIESNGEPIALDYVSK